VTKDPDNGNVMGVNSHYSHADNIGRERQQIVGRKPFVVYCSRL